jgi:sirohydrochlorin ferrochelatase
MRKAVLLVDHGSKLSEANEMLPQVAKLFAARFPELIVEFAHMELAEPPISKAFDKCVARGANDVTVHPFMLSPGRHATRDIPRLAAEAATLHPGVAYRVTDPLGLHPLLVDVIHERVEAAGKKKK